MVEVINSWSQKIIIVIIICTIIEMLLPEGKNKKYIKTVIGIYVVFTIISPIITKINTGSLDLSKYISFTSNETVETSVNIETNKYIEQVYKDKLKEDIRAKLESINYNVHKIELEIEEENEDNYGSIIKLGLEVSEQVQEQKKSNIQINKIVIGEEKIEKTDVSDKEKEEIKQYISYIYYIDDENIIIY